MGKIHILNENISNKIAAGEVVERPASVVKELVENSIDAKATSITVEIRNGGMSYIRVSDNGSGMDEEDAKNSFIRHATSKISSIDDLESIATLGFRGEALASIAAVSEVEMLTKLKSESLGVRIEIAGGKYNFIGSAGCADGTTIIVKNLFYNAPARLKFLKKESRETASITDIVYKLALSRPDISFKYINNGKLIFNTQGDFNLKNTVLNLYGREVYDSLIDVSYKGNVLSISGFIGKPQLVRANRNHQIFFINNRYIQSRMLSSAVDNAYKTYLPINKYAFCIIFISMHPEFIDVNVHPTKAEVRFQDDKEIFSALFNTVRDSLFGGGIIPEIKNEDRFDLIDENKIKISFNQLEIKETPSIETEQSMPFIIKTKTEAPKEYQFIDKEESPEKTQVKNMLPPLVIIGQCHYTYILAQGPDGLYIIDQHAAHERVMYEKFKDAFAKGGVQSQKLLSPLVVELTPEEMCTVKENAEILYRLGFEIEYFGNNSVMLRSVPLIFKDPELKKLFLEIVDSMELNSIQTKNTIDDMLYTMACKSAVKANDKLDIKEMERVLIELRNTQNPYTCPHGRPTIIKLTKNELEKKFKRIQ